MQDSSLLHLRDEVKAIAFGFLLVPISSATLVKNQDDDLEVVGDLGVAFPSFGFPYLVDD